MKYVKLTFQGLIIFATAMAGAVGASDFVSCGCKNPSFADGLGSLVVGLAAIVAIVLTWVWLFDIEDWG